MAVRPGLVDVLEVLTIGKGRFTPRQRDTSKRLRVNETIRSPEVFLVDENNEKVGIIDSNTARNRALDAGLDLVEVAPNADPPVCRIMDYGKWKYQQRKKEQKAKSHSKQSELKEVRLRPKIDEHDLLIKINKALQFLNEGHKVQFTMLFRGREMAHRELGMDVMQDVIARLAEAGKVETPPRMMGRRMTMMLSPDHGNKAKAASKPKAEAPPAEQEQPATESAATEG